MTPPESTEDKQSEAESPASGSDATQPDAEDESSKAEASETEATEPDTPEPEAAGHSAAGRVLGFLRRAWTPAEIIAALAVSVVFALSFGFNFGIDNQVVYLLGSLRILHPDLYRNDWLATHTTMYHPTFEYLGAALMALNKQGWGVAIGQTVLITTTAMCLYWLMRVISPKRYALASFVLLMSVCFLTRMHTVGTSYVIDYIMQPSSIGSLGFIAAIPAFLSGRWWLSGVLLAIGGLFHANYLILGIGVFGFAHLMLGREDLLRRLVKQLVLPSLAVLLFLPTILKAADAPMAEPARMILFHVRGRWHFMPSTYEAQYIPFIGWQLLGIGAGIGLNLLRDIRGRTSRLAAIAASLMIVIWVGTAATTSLHIDKITELFVQRLAPHTEVIMQAMAALAAVRVIADPASSRRFSKISIGLIVAGLCVLLMYEGNRKQHPLPNLLYAVVWAVVVVKGIHFVLREVTRLRPALGKYGIWWRRVGVWAALIGAGVLIEHPAVQELGHLKRRSTLLRGLNRQETELYAWLRKNTPKDAVLLTPPSVEGMRFHSHRAIVVDWKSNPFVPSEVMEWKRRLDDVTGRNVRGWGDLGGYNQLNERRLDMLKRKYGVDYVVTFRGRQGGLRGKTVYYNSRFVVLDVRASGRG